MEDSTKFSIIYGTLLTIAILMGFLYAAHPVDPTFVGGWSFVDPYTGNVIWS